MRISISNIAWDTSEDEQVAGLLKKFHIDAIDVAPGKYFPDPRMATENAITHVRKWWADRDIAIIGMQSLLFGTTGLNVFGDKISQKLMLDHLQSICKIASGLGVQRLVFGSPKNRDRTGLNDDQALSEAANFFQKLGDVAKQHEVVICLEPNPSSYGANFMTTSAETATVVQSVAHDAIKMQFDTGAVTMNAELPDEILQRYAHLIGHIHISEPGLVPIGKGSTDHELMHSELHKHLPDNVASIEMLATNDVHQLVSIERALMCATKYYRPELARLS